MKITLISICLQAIARTPWLAKSFRTRRRFEPDAPGTAKSLWGSRSHSASGRVCYMLARAVHKYMLGSLGKAGQMEQKICFIAMPFGKKSDPLTGREFDFDRVYDDLVRPAAEDTGYSVVRDDASGSGIVAVPPFEQLLSSDVFIADLTMGNPNVMYELGLRHALSNSATVLVVEAEWASRLPFDLSYARVIVYRVQPNGRLEISEATRARKMLSEAIRQGIGREGSDSPVYTFLQNLNPPELLGSTQKRRRRAAGISHSPRCQLNWSLGRRSCQS